MLLYDCRISFSKCYWDYSKTHYNFIFKRRKTKRNSGRKTTKSQTHKNMWIPQKKRHWEKKKLQFYKFFHSHEREALNIQFKLKGKKKKYEKEKRKKP